MKTMVTVILAATILIGVFAVFASALPAEAAPVQADGKKTLVAYFSRTGSTAAIAQEIQKQIGGDLFEIRAVDPYPEDYRKTTDVAMEEQQKNARPALTASVQGMERYDVVFVGYPIWWGTMPMAVFTFLEAYDFSGKTIVPFCTHGGSGLARSAADIARLCPGAKIADALVLRGSSARSAQDEISGWLRGLGM